MTDQARRFTPAAPALSAPAPTRATALPRVLLAATVALAAAAAWLATDGAEAARASAADPELTRLLRSMAATKLVVALGALALAGWRLGRLTGPVATAGWLAAAALLAAGPVLIWRIAPVELGGLAFHAGLLVLLLTAWLDRGAVGTALTEAIAERRRRRTAAGGG
jgi:hypothetical protein